MIYFNSEKLNEFKFSNNNFYVLMDFDRTITTSKSFGSWAVLENPKYMNPDFKIESKKLLEKYYPYEINYSIDFDTKFKYINEWYYKNMNLFYKYGLTENILYNCVKDSQMQFRDGFKEFLQILYKNNIPLIIVSAGIGNVITDYLKLNNCLYDNIYIISNFIEFKEGNMIPFSNNMIHSLNKNINSLPKEQLEKITSKKYSLLFGDLIEDLYMIPKENLNNCLSFGFLEQNISKNFDLYSSSFDIVLTDNSSYLDIINILGNNLPIFKE